MACARGPPKAKGCHGVIPGSQFPREDVARNRTRGDDNMQLRTAWLPDYYREGVITIRGPRGGIVGWFNVRVKNERNRDAEPIDCIRICDRKMGRRCQSDSCYECGRICDRCDVMIFDVSSGGIIGDLSWFGQLRGCVLKWWKQQWNGQIAHTVRPSSSTTRAHAQRRRSARSVSFFDGLSLLFPYSFRA